MERREFADAVYRAVARVPAGRVVTYGQVAALLDRPRAARAVGTAMRYCPAWVPWHRVVNAQGRISRRARVASMLTQKLLLTGEGVVVRRGRVNLGRYRWNARRITDEAGHAPELLRRARGDRPGHGPRGRAPRFRLDLER